MTTTTKIIIAIIALITSFAIGRFMAPERVKTVIHTVEVEKIVVQIKHEVQTITVKPDGTSTTTTVTDTNTNSHTDSNIADTSREVPVNKNIVSISALIGTKVFPFSDRVYGASISKNIVGPIRLGVFGLSDKTFGMSLGLDL